MGKLYQILKKISQLTKETKTIPIDHCVESGKELEGKTALITGATGGIGKSIAEKFVNSGCKVVLAGSNTNKLDDLRKSFPSDMVSSVCFDYSKPMEFEKRIQESVEKFGRVDIFVSCVGIHADRDDLSFFNSTIEEYDSIMNTNLKGTFFACQAVAKYMIKEHVKGHILLISSQSALEPSWSPYRLSKLGVSGMVKGLAQVLINNGIIVNGIGPGPTATKMQKSYQDNNIYTQLNPIGRFTMPNEVAEFALMLVSDIGNTIVGDVLYMSGGRGIIEIR